MPDLKADLKTPGSIRLMELDTSTLFLPFGRPVADYLRGQAGNQNGTRAALKQGAIDFSPLVRWSEFTSLRLRTTGFGEVEQKALTPAAAEPADPDVADFLAFEQPRVAAGEAGQVKTSPAIALEPNPVSLPRMSALPLRPRMTFGPPPSKAKPAAPAAKAAPPAAPAKPAPVAASKPAAAPPKPPAPVAAQAKPVTVIPPSPKPSPAPTPKVNIPAAPAASASPTLKPSAPTPVAVARVAESSPSQSKPSQAPVRAPVPPARPQESAVSTLDAPAAAPVKPAAPAVSKAPEPPPARPKPESDAPAALKPPARTNFEPAPANEPRLTLGMEAESRSFLEKVPLPAKIGIVILLIVAVLYFVLGKSGDKATGAGKPVAVGEQGWSNEWASDAVGSRRGRQITLYRPSTGMTDYQMQFSGQIESKALGWVFRAADTKNYYGMKIANIRPGAMTIGHFAVVEGRESSSSERPLAVDARPGAMYRVKLDVTGPRFTVSVDGEPVDFWTDNRIKSGAVGFMNERDERGVTSSVQFSFAQGAK